MIFLKNYKKQRLVTTNLGMLVLNKVRYVTDTVGQW